MPGAAFRHGVRHHRGHAGSCGGLVEQSELSVAPDEVANLVRDLQRLEHSDAAAISDAAASLAAVRLEDDVACAKAAQFDSAGSAARSCIARAVAASCSDRKAAAPAAERKLSATSI